MRKANVTYQLTIILVALLGLGGCATAQKPQKAATADERMLEKDYFLVEAMRYSSLGDLSSALSLVNQAINRDSLCAACFYLRGQILAKGGMAKEALAASDRAYALDSTNRWYTLLDAQLNARSGSYDSAVQRYESLLKRGNADEDVYFGLANLYAANKKYTRAFELLDTLEQREGFSESLAMAKQQLYYQSGETGKALTEAKELNRISPGNPQYLSLLADIYSRESYIDSARLFYVQAQEIDSTYAPAQFGMLDIYQKEQNLPRFYSQLEKVMFNERIDLNERLRYIALVVSDPVLGPASVAPLNDLLSKMQPKYGDKWTFTYFYATYFTQTKQPDKAIDAMESYLKGQQKPSYEEWGVYLSLLHSAQRWADLAKKADEGIKLFEKNVPLCMYKCVGLWQSKNLKGAIGALNDALSIKPKPDTTQLYDIYSMLGDLYHQDGDVKKAFASYDKALEYNANGIAVFNNYAYYLGERGERLDKALAMSKKAVEAEPNNPTFLDTFGWIYYKLGMYSEAKNTFRQAIMYGGRTMSVLLDHYAEVLFALKEYDAAIIYWEFALDAADCENPDVIKDKISKAKATTR